MSLLRLWAFLCNYNPFRATAVIHGFSDFIKKKSNCVRFYCVSPLFFFTGRVGCPHYIAPEVLTRRQYGKACDVWGAGVMLHVLLSGRLPFNGSGRRLQEAIARGRVPVGWRKGSNEQRRFFFLVLVSIRSSDSGGDETLSRWYF